MTIEQAKKIPIASFLESMGWAQERRYGNEIYFRNPDRQQRTGSLVVNIQKNRWYDHSTGVGGDIVNLAREIFRTDTQGALTGLNKLFGNQLTLVATRDGSSSPKPPHFSFSKQNGPQTTRYEIRRLSDPQLLDYLQRRGIPKAIALRYLEEAFDQRHTYLAFQNDQGGYELRNSFGRNGFKGTVKPKSITTIPGTGGGSINLFEGFMDFLSALRFFELDVPNNDTIVLNSTALIRRVLPILSDKTVNCFLDRDRAGAKCLNTLSTEGVMIRDRSSLYNGFNDFNDYLCQSLLSE